ncbi:MAG TPA: hypothetical protein VIL86_19050 [Tepidisphaeraceae bacterium]|jgi:hypothetical protein
MSEELMPRRFIPTTAIKLARLGLLVVALGLQAQVTRAAAPDAEELFRKSLESERKNLENSPYFKGLKLIEQHRIEDVLELRLENNRLVLRTPMNNGVNMQQVRAELDGIGGHAMLTVRADGKKDQPAIPLYLDLNIQDYSDPNAMVGTQVSSNQGFVSINRTYRTIRGYKTIRLTQTTQGPNNPQPSLVQFQVTSQTMQGQIDANINLTEPDMSALRRQHPREVEEFLVPLFRDLHQEAVFSADPLVAWQVFADEWKPDEQLLAKVQQQLPALDDPDVKKREAAMLELKKMGKDAALVILHMKRTDLSAEQNARLDAAIASFTPVSARLATQLRKDPNFLLDCLYCNDETVRAIALRKLSDLTGHQLDFNPKAELAERIVAVNKLRIELLTPSTQPVKQ